MKITKELKHATFEYDEEAKVFTLYDCEGMNGAIELNKVYAFAFMRFVVRMAQRNWLRDKPIKKEKDKPTELAERPFCSQGPNQAEFTYEEVLLPEDYDKEDFNEKTKKQWDDLPF